MNTNRTALALVCGLVGVVSTACSTESADPSSDVSNVTSAATCSEEQVVRMVNAPVRPLSSVGGVALLGAANRPSTFEEIERAHCKAKQLGSDETTFTSAFGDANEISLTFDAETREVAQFQLGAGYRGTLDFASRPTSLTDPSKPNPFGQHTYSIRVGLPVLRDDKNFDLQWTKKCTEAADNDCWEKQSAELFDALMYTFAPNAPSTQESCIKAQTCLAKFFSTGDGVFGVRPLGIYLYVPTVVGAVQPAPSTPAYLYGFIRPLSESGVIPPRPPVTAAAEARIAPREQ